MATPPPAEPFWFCTYSLPTVAWNLPRPAGQGRRTPAIRFPLQTFNANVRRGESPGPEHLFGPLGADTGGPATSACLGAVPPWAWAAASVTLTRLATASPGLLRSRGRAESAPVRRLWGAALPT